jgi:hypothetical protein
VEESCGDDESEDDHERAYILTQKTKDDLPPHGSSESFFLEVKKLARGVTVIQIEISRATCTSLRYLHTSIKLDEAE